MWGYKYIFYGTGFHLVNVRIKKNTSFVIVGDCNINVLDFNQINTCRFSNLLASYGLRWMVDSSIWATATLEATINKVISNVTYGEIPVKEYIQYSCSGDVFSIDIHKPETHQAAAGGYKDRSFHSRLRNGQN